MTSSRIHPLLSIIALGCLILLLTIESGGTGALGAIATWLYGTVVALGAATLLLGVLNVVLLHVRRIRLGESEWSFSLVLLLCLVGTLVVGTVSPNGVFSPIVGWIFDWLIAPGQAALFALLPFFLAVAAWRYLRMDRQAGRWMLAGVLLMIFIQLPSGWEGELFADIPWLPHLFQGTVMAVMQGVLLGGALTIVAVGVRMLMGRR